VSISVTQYESEEPSLLGFDKDTSISNAEEHAKLQSNQSNNRF